MYPFWSAEQVSRAREAAPARIFTGKTWTAPTLADGKLYLRDESEIVSLDVSG
jgi:hypothetical protein